MLEDLVLVIDFTFDKIIFGINCLITLFDVHFFTCQLVNFLMDHLSHQVYFFRPHWSLRLMTVVLHHGSVKV